jgi:SAM-dependent methyltransferase
MKLIDWLLERPLVYRAWQKPFVEQKLSPIRRRGDITRARRVLDVGCGPGTNTSQFGNADYVGIDINPSYIASAMRRHPRRFVVADVTTYSATDEGKFDFIFVNSLLHHIDTPGVRRLLSHLAILLSDEGHVHIVDLVLPPERFSIPRALARADRGDFPRPLEEWRQLFGEAFEIVDFEAYPLVAGGVTLWNLVYCKGRIRAAACDLAAMRRAAADPCR